MSNTSSLHQVAHLDGASVHVEPASPERDTAHSATGHDHG